jgi:hypothetical protein
MDPLGEIDDMIGYVSQCTGQMPDCFYDLETGELITKENFGDWLKGKDGTSTQKV